MDVVEARATAEQHVEDRTQNRVTTVFTVVPSPAASRQLQQAVDIVVEADRTAVVDTVDVAAMVDPPGDTDVAEGSVVWEGIGAGPLVAREELHNSHQAIIV